MSYRLTMIYLYEFKTATGEVMKWQETRDYFYSSWASAELAKMTLPNEMKLTNPSSFKEAVAVIEKIKD
jgi:hypothetical protein